ncbi:uncharacterized protein LOC135155319 [Lytechinus pictus]|uniref:uncharacterized protein LOC135155319 n=1 Tax=Lytechinus pictus TaxID=7653 RepID=UPI0030B9FC03
MSFCASYHMPVQRPASCDKVDRNLSILGDDATVVQYRRVRQGSPIAEMADDVTVDPSLRKKVKEPMGLKTSLHPQKEVYGLTQLEDIHIDEEPSTAMTSISKVKEPMGLKTSLHPQKEMYGLTQLEDINIYDEPSTAMTRISKVKEPMGLKTSLHPQKEMYGLTQLEDIHIDEEPSTAMTSISKVKEPMGLKTSLHPQKEMYGLTQLEDINIYDEPSTAMTRISKVKERMGLKTSLHPQKEMSGSSQVKELTEGNLRGQSPLQVKLPSELNDALSDIRRLHVFDRYGWSRYYKQHGNIDRYQKLKRFTTKVSDIEYGNEYHQPISWNIDDDGAWIVFEDELPLDLIEMIYASVPLCQKVEHITTVFGKHRGIHTRGSQPFIPMRSVLSVYLYVFPASPHESLQIVSRCFPNAKSLVLDCGLECLFEFTSRHHSGIQLSSLRRLEFRIVHCYNTLDLFLMLSSSCQNIESLTVTSDDPLKWEKSRTATTECKLPNLTDIHLESRWSDEHYALQIITDLLHLGRMMSPSLKFVKVKSVELGDVVMKSAEWSRTSSDCGLQIQGASAEELLLPEELPFEWPRYALRKSAAVPIIELVDIATSEFKEVTVLTLVSCKIDFGQSESKSPQSPKELGTLREIRFVGSENPLSESDRNKLSELYPNVKVTEKQESQESSEESQEGAGIPSKLDKVSSQPLKTSPIVPDEGDVETTKKECCKRVGTDGGRLELESFGIELEIPPGAIDSKEPQEISLRVLTDTPNLGDTKEEMSVCFGVQCLAPDDLVLRSPVTYTIPHCAVATRYSSLEAVLYTGEGEYTPVLVTETSEIYN